MDEVDRFFDQARRAFFSGEAIVVDPEDLWRIAEDNQLRHRFQRTLNRELNDEELRHRIVEYLKDLAEAQEIEAVAADREVDLIDRAALTVAAGTTVAGVGATIVSFANPFAIVSVAGPGALMIGGFVGLVIAAMGRHRLKRRADRRKRLGSRLRRLSDWSGK